MSLLPAHATYCVPFAFDRQLFLAELIGDFNWSYDLQAGLLSFGNRYQWHTQVLGTESDESRTWLWAWANKASNIPDHLLQASRIMRAFGEQHEFPELTSHEVPLDEIDAHFLALIASGVCRANGYYRGPYEGGAVFLLIQDDSYPCNMELPLTRIATVFPQAISALEIPNHRLALLSYLASYGILGRSDGKKIIVEEGGEARLTATFDEQNRLIKLDARLDAAPR